MPLNTNTNQFGNSPYNPVDAIDALGRIISDQVRGVYAGDKYVPPFSQDVIIAADAKLLELINSL